MKSFVLFLTFVLFSGVIEAQWVQTNGPYAGKVNCFAECNDGHGDTTFFIGTDKGIYLSSNNGTSWISSGLTNTSINALAVSSNGSGGTNIFAGTDDNGIFKSSNNGVNWARVYDSSVYIYSFAVSGKDIYAGTFRYGVLYSSDNGTSWVQKDSGLSYTYNSINALLINDTNVFAGMNGGIFESTNNGTSWMQVDKNLSNESVYSFAVVPNGAGGTYLFAGTDNGICRSTDNGTTWFRTNIAAPTFNSLAVISNGTNSTYLYAVMDSIIMITTNYGATWMYPGMSTNPNKYLPKTKNISLFASGTNLFAGSFNGVLRSTYNCLNWTWLNNGLTNIRNTAFTSYDNNLFVGTYDYGVFLSTNNGANWVQTGLGNRTVLCLAVIPNKSSSNGTGSATLFAGTEVDGIFRSTDNGGSWTQINNGLGKFNQLINSLVVIDTIIFTGTDYGVFLSSDNGTTWNPVNTGFSKYISVEHLTVSANPGSSDIYASTSINGIFRSTNNGSNWTQTGMQNGYILALASSYTQGNVNIYAGTSVGVYLSSDNGTNWLLENNGLTVTFISTLAVIDSLIFAGAGNNIYLSTNNGTSWVQVYTGATGAIVDALSTYQQNVFMGIDYGGVWKRPISEMLTGVKKEQNNLPASFKLEQNYPNPFNPSTTINYQLPKSNFVTLKVYDVLGREVRTLVNEREAAGNHSVIFNAGGLPSGIYFYRIAAGSFTDVKKLIILK